jgi:hypothetical protein
LAPGLEPAGFGCRDHLGWRGVVGHGHSLKT